jgi:predicted nucleic acid-binding protein
VVAGLVYLDASAIVRLVLEEPGWEGLVGFLREHPTRVTSALSTTEVIRAVRRAGGSAETMGRAHAVLGRLDQVGLSPDLLRRAGELEPAHLRTLDAIHLATALELAPLAAMVTYDDRLGKATASYGLRVEAPD